MRSSCRRLETIPTAVQWALACFVLSRLVPLLAGAAELPLTLAEAQARAVEQNTMLVAARAQVQGAEARRLQTGGGLWPSLRVSEGFTATNDPVNAFGFRLKQGRFTQDDFAVESLNNPDDLYNWQTKVELQQPLFDGIASWNRRKQASQGVLAAEAELEHQIQQVRFETARAYWGHALAAASLAAMQEGLATASAHARDAEARFTQETITLPDLLAAQLRVAELEEQVILAESRRDGAAEALGLVMGLEVATRVVPRDSLARQEAVWSVDSLVVVALQARPDLSAASYRAEAARKGAAAAGGGFWPRLDAFGSAEINSEDLAARDGDSWTAGAMLHWYLFAGGRTRGGYREAQAQAAAATAVLAFEKQRAEREVRQAHRDLQAARKRIDVADAAQRQASERLRITELQYREGVATTTDLLSAQSGKTEARLRHVQALHDLNVGIARLAFLVGGSLD